MRDQSDDDPRIPEQLRAIGERVRAERRRQNLTQDQVWQVARLDRRTVQNVEAGRDVKISTLIKIAHALNVPLTDLMQ